jgi:hypothetical protein
MKENVVAAITAISVPACAVPDGWPVPNPRKISMETRNSIVIAYPLLKSHTRFSFADDRQSSGTNGPYFSCYICGADNSVINDITVVV